MWWSTKNNFLFQKVIELSMEMAKEGGSSRRRSGSNTSVTKKNAAGPSSRRSRDKKNKMSDTVNSADKNKSNNKSTVVSSVNTIKITPPKVVAARARRLRARPAEQTESSVKVSETEKQQLESMGYILSNVLVKEQSCIKFRAHYLHSKENSLLRQKHHLWCKAISDSDVKSIDDLKTRELQMLSKLRHHNLAALHGLVHFNDKIFLFTRGGMYGNVMDFLSNYGPIYENHGRVWFKQIVSALDYLHNVNIAHNDLNCETLLLSNRYNVLIGDFSRACYLCENGKRVLRKFDNRSLYSAPEILLGDACNPPLAEMWSLGVILYCFFMGHPPFRYYGDGDEQIAKLVLDQIRQVWLWKPNQKTLSREAWQIVSSLLEPDSLKRANIGRLKDSEFYCMRECACGIGSYKTISQDILGSLPDVYATTKSLPKWAVDPKHESKTKVVCPLIRQFFSPRKELMLKIEDAEAQPPPAPPMQTPIMDSVINLTTSDEPKTMPLE